MFYTIIKQFNNKEINPFTLHLKTFFCILKNEFFFILAIIITGKFSDILKNKIYNIHGIISEFEMTKGGKYDRK